MCRYMSERGFSMCSEGSRIAEEAEESECVTRTALSNGNLRLQSSAPIFSMKLLKSGICG